MGRTQGPDWLERLDGFLVRRQPGLVAFRRDLHMHPEASFQEFRTTERILHQLETVGLTAVRLPKGTGAICDIGSGKGPIVALRADIDALRLTDEKSVPYRSTNLGVCHACGHDVHTTAVLGAGLFLSGLADEGLLPGTVRLVFQPAEETLGGALDVVASGGLAGVQRIFGLHCEPKYEVGQVGLRDGAITGAYDRVRVHIGGMSASGRHPDLIFALAKIITELPAALSRRIDPRSSLSLVWGTLKALPTDGLLPDSGIAEGTVRCFDEAARRRAPGIIEELVRSVASAYDIEASLKYIHGIPPTVNESNSVGNFRDAAQLVLGENKIFTAPQSLGGDDFGVYLQEVPGAYARLGVRAPGQSDYDLHQGIFDVDERSISVGVRLLAVAALMALSQLSLTG
ncbi:amidohydrolase [Nonomuraea sp. KM90]|uniref:amidohydrolase n=1 Tax=Nonomuraea sp. KM90 TaxID=3457428 RepID=UPI003FCDCFC6